MTITATAKRSGGEPTRVAVLGGGVGAITAAFDLTRPELEGRYEVTVYQMGWRLGGKGASGRGAHDRIEEHGLHLWFGFYENAFRLMRECYDELDRDLDAPLARVDDAFRPAARFGVTEHRLDRWSSWVNWFPDTDGAPGVDHDGSPSPGVAEYVEQLLELGVTVMRGLMTVDGDHVRVRTHDPSANEASVDDGVGEASHGSVRAVVAPPEQDLSTFVDATRRRVDQIASVVDELELSLLVAAYEAAATIESVLDWAGTGGSRVVGLLDQFVDGLEDRIAATLQNQEAGRRVLEMVDLAATIVRGLIADGVVAHPDGFAALDHYDLRDWLSFHGARRSTVQGGVVRGIYDLVFAYRDGQANRPSFAAGQALRGSFRMFFGYRGSFAYRMQAGMGDTVFAPYYEVLRTRGVKFEFFHRVTDLRPSDDGRRIDEIVLERQARVPDGEYDPLVPVKGLPCWPAEPKWNLLADVPIDDDGKRPNFELTPHRSAPAESQITLEAGADFDRIVFGLSLGSVPLVCPGLLAQKREWRAMVEHVGTVQTQALQIWLKESTGQLGGDPDSPVISGFVEPFDTWADMSHLIDRESWPREGGPASLHYFCSAMSEPAATEAPVDDDDVAEREYLRALYNSHRFLDYNVAHFLPRSAHAYPAEFRWDLLVGDDAGASGSDRLASQFIRANWAPSERYVQSLPGTDKYRLKPGDSGYDNLVLAGDWTDCGFNAGCVEAATMSGLLAARAITGDDHDDVVGYDHP